VYTTANHSNMMEYSDDLEYQVYTDSLPYITLGV